MKPRRSFLLSSAGALAALVFLATFPRALAEDGPAKERAIWQERCKKVYVGMTRAEVEKILPPYKAPAGSSGELIAPYSAVVTMGIGSRQATRYYVSPGWCVVITYDYTGVTRDASGTATSRTSPENKLLEAVTLEYRPESLTKPVPKKEP